MTIDRHTLERVCQDPAAVRPLFQSVVDLGSDSIAGHELLADVQGPEDVPTPAWFSAAVEYGLEGALEARILRTALASRRQLPGGRFISLNVSPRALRSTQVQGIFRQEERFDTVVLELAEGDVGEEGLPASLEPFRSAGGRVAVDSIGAGRMSLRGIVELRPDLLKLDRSLVAGVDGGETQRVVVEVVAALAGRLGAALAAVGVERREEAETLGQLGVSLAQGFLFGRRQPAISDAGGSG